MKKCKLCRKDVSHEEYDNFSGYHAKCENELGAIFENRGEEE